MLNLAACLRKLELFHELGNTEQGVSRFVVTEIEYIASSCRSQYDILQRMAQILWGSVTLKDSTIKKNSLPDTFSRMIGENKKITPLELQKKYGLGPKWAEFYSHEADFFLKLRKLRNDIEHGGLTPQIIFATHLGFAVHAESTIFSPFGKTIWQEETFLPNRLAPLKPVIAYIIATTLASMHNFIAAITQEIVFAEEIAPGYRVFMRGYYMNRAWQD